MGVLDRCIYCHAEYVLVLDWAPHTAGCVVRRRCKNPSCGKVLDPVRVERWDAKSCDSACRAAAWKIERDYRRHDRQAVRPRANGRSRSGLQVPYRKAVEAVADVVRDFSAGYFTELEARELAVTALSRALSERQRARLEARER